MTRHHPGDALGAEGDLGATTGKVLVELDATVRLGIDLDHPALYSVRIELRVNRGSLVGPDRGGDPGSDPGLHRTTDRGGTGRRAGTGAVRTPTLARRWRSGFARQPAGR